jgi:lipid-A-disaccharide synthase
MKRLDPGLTFLGIGGKMMENAGVNILISSSEIAVVGFTEVMARLYTIVRAHFKLKSLLKNSRPDLLILIDYPGFNINLARSAKRFRIPVLYYISPQIWAWRRGRIKKMAKRVDRIAVILPFEKEFYLKSGMDVEYVGHPLLDAITLDFDKSNVIQDMGFTDGCPIVGLLPGSRREEVRNLLPLMIKAVEILYSHYPKIRCVLAMAPTISADLVESLISQSTVEITISREDIYRTLRACDLALVTSGTATLETAIMGVPMIIVYRASLVSYWVGRMVVKVPYIGLVNLVAGEQVVPELIQDEVTPQSLSDEALAILESDQRREDMRRNLHMVREKLGRGGASERTARIALGMIRSD